MIGRQPQARALIGRLAGEEGLEAARGGFRVHTAAFVADRAAALLLVAGDPHRDSSAAGHRVARVDQEVEQHLFELGRIDAHGRGRIAGFDGEFDVLAEQRVGQFAQGRHHRGQIDHARLVAVAPGEGQQPPGGRRALLRRRQDALHVSAEFRLRAELRAQQLRLAHDRGEDVVEVVHHAARQAADRLHLLRLQELVLDLVAFAAHLQQASPFAEIPDDRHRVELALVLDRVGVDLGGQGRAVAAPQLGLQVQALASPQSFPEPRPTRGVVVQVDVPDRVPQELVAAHLQHLGGRTVHVEEAAVGVDPVHALAGVIDREAGQVQRLLGALALGDVARHAHDADDRARGVAPRRLAHREPAQLAAGRTEGLDLIDQGRAAGEDLLLVALARLGLLGREEIRRAATERLVLAATAQQPQVRRVVVEEAAAAVLHEDHIRQHVGDILQQRIADFESIFARRVGHSAMLSAERRGRKP